MKRKLQFLWLLFITFIDRHKKFIALGGLIGFFTTLIFLQAYPLYTRLSGVKTKRIGIAGRFTATSLPLSIQNQLSLGLTNLLPSGETTASLAQKWEVDATGKVYTFYLRSGIYWHNGTHFTSKDISYRIKDAKIETPGENIYRVILKEPFAPLPTILSLPLLKPNLIGLGVYKMANVDYSGDYLSTLTLKPQVSDLSSIIYKFYPTENDAILAFKLGEVDMLENMTDIQDLSTWKKINITETTLYDSFVGIFFDVKNSFFKEKEIRQALTYAVPNTNNYTKSFTPISPLSWAYSAKVRLYRFDPDTATKMLAKSELASPSSEVTISTFAPFVKLAQSIVDAWSKVGVHVKVRVINAIPPDYQVLLVAQAIPPDPDQYQFWQSTQTVTNLAHYSNLKIDKLLEDGRKTLDLESRKKIYADFQRYLVDDAPVIFLYYPKIYTVERK